MSKETDDYKRGWYDGFKAGRFDALQQPIDNYPVQRQVKCSKCKLSWEGVVGFSCPDIHCPIQIKPVSITSYTT